MLLFKVRRLYSPHMGEFRGYRMALAIPNESGFAGQPAFSGKYLVAESSDMTESPTLQQMVVWVQEFARGERVSVVNYKD